MIFVGIVIFLILVYFLYTRTGTGRLGKIFFPALLFKLLCGIGIGLIYFEHYGTGDTLEFDRAANLVLHHIGFSFRNWFGLLFLSDLSFIDSSLPHVLRESRSLFFIKLLTPIYLITGRSYWISSLFFSLASFSGGWFLFRTISRHRPDMRIGASIAFLFFPAIIFWSSGILKDSVAFACLTGIMGLIVQVNFRQSIRWEWVVLGILLFLILWAVKYHYAAILLVSIISVGLYRFVFFSFSGKYKTSWFLLLMVFVFFLLSLLHPNFRLDAIFEVMASNQEALINASREGSHVEYLPWGTDWVHFLINLPVSFLAGLFLPLPWQGTGILPKIAGVFNLLVLLFTLVRIFQGGIQLKHRPGWQWIFAIYILILTIVIAYTTPNFGTLERYKTGYLPFFLLWVFSDRRLLKILKSKFW